MLKRFLRFVSRYFFSTEDSSRDTDPECSIDIEQTIRKLKLDRQAQDAARRGMPPTGALQPDGTERKIQAMIQQRMAAWTHQVNQKLIAYNTALSKTDLNNEQQRIRNLAENAKLRLNSRLAEAEQQLGVMKEDLERNTSYFRSFQQKNRRENDAEYPESRLYHYSLVLLVLLVEALANGYFFARGSEFGMLGGISQSLIVAMLNIMPAFLFAGMLCLRYTIHVNMLKRMAAYCALLFFATYMLGFNLSVAHYREILAASDEIPVKQVVDRLLSSPFGLNDLNSWLMLSMGIFFSLVAMADGYKSDDPYPGYGKIQRLNDEIREDYEFECQRLAAEANQIRKNFLDELDMLKDNAKSAYSHLCHLAEAKPALIARHKQGLETLAQTGDALIHHYRSTNAQYRNTPVPAYFNENWKAEIHFELVGSHDEGERIRRQKKIFESFPAFLQQTSNDLEQVYAAFFDRLQRIEPAIRPAAMRYSTSPA